MSNYIKNIYSLILASIYAVFLFRPKKVCNIRNIVIFHSGKLGDMVCATPVFRAIRRNNPECKIVVFGSAINKEIMKDSIDIDHYEIIQKSFFCNARNVSKYRPDYVFQLTPSYSNLVSMVLSNAKMVATPKIENGYSPYETKSYKILSKLVIGVPHRMSYYAPLEYLKLLEPIEIFSSDTKKYLSYSDEAKNNTEVIIKKYNPQGKKSICFSVTAGNRVKEWGKDKFTELIGKVLNNKDVLVYIIGSKTDISMCREVADSLNSVNLINVAGIFNIDSLKAFISKMDLFVSVDTGPIYIAEAFGIATVDIIGPMDEREQPPRGPRNLVVYTKREKPQLHIMNSRVYNYEEARRQVDRISVQQVYEAINKLI